MKLKTGMPVPMGMTSPLPASCHPPDSGIQLCGAHWPWTGWAGMGLVSGNRGHTAWGCSHSQKNLKGLAQVQRSEDRQGCSVCSLHQFNQHPSLCATKVHQTHSPCPSLPIPAMKLKLRVGKEYFLQIPAYHTQPSTKGLASVPELSVPTLPQHTFL